MLIRLALSACACRQERILQHPAPSAQQAHHGGRVHGGLGRLAHVQDPGQDGVEARVAPAPARQATQVQQVVIRAQPPAAPGICELRQAGASRLGPWGMSRARQGWAAGAAVSSPGAGISACSGHCAAVHIRYALAVLSTSCTACGGPSFRGRLAVGAMSVFTVGQPDAPHARQASMPAGGHQHMVRPQVARAAEPRRMCGRQRPQRLCFIAVLQWHAVKAHA